MVPGGHEHMGMWLMTWHVASALQVPAHGSPHLFLMQALSLGQSEFNTHSGLHPKYGSPWYSSMQVQVPSLHIAFDPHGEGEQGSTASTSVTRQIRSKIRLHDIDSYFVCVLCRYVSLPCGFK